MRKFIDCRQMPNEVGCTLAISADGDDELVEAAVQHAIAIHGHRDGPELREGLRGAIHEGAAPA